MDAGADAGGAESIAAPLGVGVELGDPVGLVEARKIAVHRCSSSVDEPRF